MDRKDMEGRRYFDKFSFVRRRGIQHIELPPHLKEWDFEIDMTPAAVVALESSEHQRELHGRFDFKIVGISKKSSTKKLESFLYCTHCKGKPSKLEYAFCSEFEHIFCGPCTRNIRRCVGKSKTGGICSNYLLMTDIPLYTDLLENDFSFRCLFQEDGCSFKGSIEKLQKHIQRKCSRVPIPPPFACPVTSCEALPTTCNDLIAHLKSQHKTLLVETCIPLVSLQRPWRVPIVTFNLPWDIPDGVEEYTWIPAILKVTAVFFIVTFKLKEGNFYEWVHLFDDRRGDNEEVFLLSGFEDIDTQEAVLSKETFPELQEPFCEILKRNKCYAKEVKEFQHLFVKEKQGKRSVQYVMNYAVL